MSQGSGQGRSITHQETAYRLKGRFQWLQDFSDDELRGITICSTGEPMQSDELYFDISHPERGVIHSQPGELIPDGSCYVPKSEVRQDLWDKLVGPFHH